MLRSVVTVAKVTLVFLNIWVLAVVLVVSLGHWRVFESEAPDVSYDNSHLIVMRELKDTDKRMVSTLEKRNFQSFCILIFSKTIQQAPQEVKNPTQQPIVAATTKSPPAAAASHGLTAADGRVANLKQWCKQQHPHKVPYEKVPSSKLTSILVDEKHKLLFCQIPGVALNDWRKIVLILSGVVNASSTGAISGGDVFGKYAKNTKRLSDFDEKKRVEFLKNFYKVVFVRDPLERLVNAYRTKLLAKSSKYFHKAFGSQMIKKYRKNAKDKEIKDGSDVRFPEFVKYIIDNEHDGVTSLNEHWEQYYKQCHPCLVDYDFVGTYEDVERDTDQVLAKVNGKKLFKPPYVWDTKPLPQKDLLKVFGEVSAQELNNLYKVYAADYTLFGYECPEFMHTLLKKGNIVHDY
ncbi:unnamed protein product [Lymnaea stagnalis]|uniref:Carbohydrate sulfotransferase n=1 Tax=Lymnaea stagnalis TaxID=6523 RepID=A0AAV2IP49_LYMST